MKKEGDAQLASIRRGLWSILGVLLLMFGFDHTPIGDSRPGALIAILGLVTGILLIAFVVGATVFRFLMRLKEMADGEENT